MLRNYGLVVLLCTLCLVLGAVSPASAHDLTLSGIRIVYRERDILVTVTTPISRLLRAEGTGRTTMTPVELDLAVRRRLHLRFGGKEVLAQQAEVVGDSVNDLLSWQTTLPGTSTECEVMARLYPEDPNARTLATVIRNSKVVQEELLTASHPALLHRQPALRPGAIFLLSLRAGIIQLCSEPAHLFFVLALLLLGGTFKSLLRTLTLFAIAAGTTLTLATTGLWNPVPRLVEALLALSLVAIAVENLRQLKSRSAAQKSPPSPSDTASQNALRFPTLDLRPYYAFGFGLIHGFGFIGVPNTLGLSIAAIRLVLVAFSSGVEIAQVVILLVSVAVLTRFARTQPVVLQRLSLAVSLITGVAGATWFFNRLGSF